MRRCPLDIWTARRLGLNNAPLGRADLERYQGEALARLLAHCTKHAPLYRRKWAQIDTTALRTTEDLQRLPCTSEDELRHHGADMLCVSQDAIARIVTLRSSGSTGPAKRLFFTEEDLERTRDFFHHGMLHLVEPGQSVAILLPGERPDSTGALLAEALERIPACSRNFGLVEDLEHSAGLVAAWQPEVLVGFPVQILALTRMARYARTPLTSLKSVLLCSDYIPESVVTALVREQGCAVFSHYGSVESGLGAAVDCSAHCGMHVRESDLIIEIVDGALRRQQPGQWGEILITTLTRSGMPLVRYRSGDRGRLLPGRCACGSELVRLDRVRGRIRSPLIRGDAGSLGLPELDEALFSLPDLLDYKTALHHSPGSGPCLQVDCLSLPGSEGEMQHSVSKRLAALPQLSGVRLLIRCRKGTVLPAPGKRQLIDLEREDPGHEGTGF